MTEFTPITTCVLLCALCFLPFAKANFGVNAGIVTIVIIVIAGLLLIGRAVLRHIEQDLRRKIAIDLYEQYWDSTKVQMPPIDVANSLNIYNSIALRNYWAYRALGVISLASSLFLAVSLGDKEALIPIEGTKILAFISSLSTGVIFSFNIVAKGNRARKAFRHLLNASMLYQHCEIDMATLLERYKEAEEIMGDDEFRSGSGGAASSTSSSQ
ncbi:hypothetical protein [Hymenobacter cheonanensis]|uniref:hypothetical protein n=1 Tax=Hymenobacter sp. CA2-7 TaxID=3063993 RepID=UPI002712FC78|nr:hypothetical protein [Hymenobacter sp. CA2-7]MDO7886843.1 hypothetical protein [Hymenobacter sp. CA2-7]